MVFVVLGAALADLTFDERRRLKPFDRFEEQRRRKRLVRADGCHQCSLGSALDEIRIAKKWITL